MNYEESIKRLNEIVAALESGKLSLQESIDYYKEGTKLSLFCKQQLEQAKQQIINYNQEI